LVYKAKQFSFEGGKRGFGIYRIWVIFTRNGDLLVHRTTSITIIPTGRDAEMTTAKGHYADYKMRILDFFIVNIVDVGPGQAMVPHAQYGHGLHMMGMLGAGGNVHNYFIGMGAPAAAPTPMLGNKEKDRKK
jgi:hypothetical protein